MFGFFKRKQEQVENEIETEKEVKKKRFGFSFLKREKKSQEDSQADDKKKLSVSFGFLKKKKQDRKNGEKKKEVKNSVRLFKDCFAGSGKKKWSVILNHYRIRLVDKAEDFSVYDKQSKKWIVFRKREKVKERPLFPVLLEVAKAKSGEFSSLHLFLSSSCGACEVAVVPQMDKIQEKFKVNSSTDADTLRNNVVLAFANSLSVKPFFLLTNDKKLLEAVRKRVETLPRPDDVKKRMLETIDKAVVVVDDPVDYCLKLVKSSKELKLPQEIEIKPKHLVVGGVVLVLLTASYFGYSYYKQKKEEEARRLAELQRKQQFVPSLKFKKEHLFYKEFEKEVKKLGTFIYSLNGNVREASINGNGYRIVYEYDSPVVGAEKRRGKFEKTVTGGFSFPSPSWESLRRKNPVYLPSAVSIYELLPDFWKKSVKKVEAKSVEGVKLICFDVNYSDKLPSYKVYEVLESLPATTYVKQVQLTRRGDDFSLTVRASVCGTTNLEVRDEKSFGNSSTSNPHSTSGRGEVLPPQGAEAGAEAG